MSSTKPGSSLQGGERHVVFAGAGPRAVSALERLLSRYAQAAPGIPLRITLIDPFEAGSGRVWRADQSRLLLCNTSAGDTTLFPDATVPLTGPLRTGPTCHEWARAHIDGSWPAWVRGEAQTLEPWTQPSRALLGAYFRWVLDGLLSSLPAGVTVTELRDRVTDVSDTVPGGCGPQRVSLAGGGQLQADVVVLAQGFVAERPSPRDARLQRAAADLRLRYVPPGLAVEQDWSVVPAGADVIVRGLGATLFDLIGLLFEGRGGKYREVGDGLAYEPGGDEPRLLIGSGEGLPKRAQHPGQVPRPELAVFTPDVVADLAARHAGRHDLRFAQDIWPLADAELRHAFGTVPAGSAPALPTGHVAYSWSALAHPARGRTFGSFAAWSEFAIGYLRREAAGATGHASGWLAARAAVLGVRPLVAALETAGALADAAAGEMSAADFYRGASKVTSGPPARRFLQFAALVSSGFVVLTGPSTEVRATADGFRAASATVAGEGWAADMMIEAYQRFGDLARADDDLVSSLLRARTARLHDAGRGRAGQGHGGPAARCTSFDLEPQSYALVDAAGTPCPRRLVLGMAGSAHQRSVGRSGMPGSADPFFSESDRVAGAVLVGLAIPDTERHASARTRGNVMA